MKIGLIDLDRKAKNPFPNLSLMKLSAWHKSLGDAVDWYQPMFSGHVDKVYMSKVFSFSPDYDLFIDADEIIKGGSGFAIEVNDGFEIYHKEQDPSLPYEIEHIYPDYSIYGITNTAYGFITRGCPRQCDFCHVKDMQGTISHKVADLNEFWSGQKNIVLLDPNISACPDWKDVFQQLIDSNAYVDFSQGLDIRLMTDAKIEMLKKIKIKSVHFAFDRYEDKDVILPKLKAFHDITGWLRDKITVYVLCGFNTNIDQDLERIMAIRELNMQPYVMLYDKEHIPKRHQLHYLQRYVNNKYIFWSNPTFEDYLKNK